MNFFAGLEIGKEIHKKATAVIFLCIMGLATISQPVQNWVIGQYTAYCMAQTQPWMDMVQAMIVQQKVDAFHAYLKKCADERQKGKEATWHTANDPTVLKAHDPLPDER